MPETRRSNSARRASKEYPPSMFDGSSTMRPQTCRSWALVSARRGQPDAVEVVVDVEVLRLHPHRVVDVEHRVVQLTPESGHAGDAPLQLRTEGIEGVPTLHVRRVQHDEATDVQELGPGL